MSEKKSERTESNTLDAPGFRLLKPGKTIGPWLRGKDQVMRKGDKKHVQENISKASYVPHSYIKANGLNLKHFETKVYDVLPKIEKLSIKVTDAMLLNAKTKLAPVQA